LGADRRAKESRGGLKAGFSQKWIAKTKGGVKIGAKDMGSAREWGKPEEEGDKGRRGHITGAVAHINSFSSLGGGGDCLTFEKGSWVNRSP